MSINKVKKEKCIIMYSSEYKQEIRNVCKHLKPSKHYFRISYCQFSTISEKVKPFTRACA